MATPVPALRVVIDRRICVGTSNCAEEAPEGYEMNEDGSPRVSPAAAAAALLAGAHACPVGAISCFDVATGRRVFP
ncbi:hypothetical protein LBMAG42_49100 [Deltaproteobacteria bacterium]|nr:hypothetical protein LBMAG42_49100 [Deltaproteobacteria bacterium]